MTAAVALVTVLLAAAALLVPSGGRPPQPAPRSGHAPTHIAGPYDLTPARDVWGQMALEN